MIDIFYHANVLSHPSLSCTSLFQVYWQWRTAEGVSSLSKAVSQTDGGSLQNLQPPGLESTYLDPPLLQAQSVIVAYWTRRTLGTEQVASSSPGWKYNIVSHVHKAFDYLGPFRVLCVHMAWYKSCVQKSPSRLCIGQLLIVRWELNQLMNVQQPSFSFVEANYRSKDLFIDHFEHWSRRPHKSHQHTDCIYG